ncbi:MAG: hypothetical protein KatS3mg105_4054 [Gemmatales bacterium]|nr:MAG: hypothetical protein KatS3mg105_4054 [Gemmatales bacterium]
MHATGEMKADPPLRASQPALFHWLRGRLLRNSVAVVLENSFIRVIGIGVLSLLIWGFVFAISVEGFAFLARQRVPLTGAIVSVLFDFMFLVFFVMLIFSNGIILYSSLFSSAETTFLLTTPARADQIFAYKFEGALGFSSYAFVLLGSPVLIAHGLAVGVDWHFYVLLVMFISGFVLLPGSLGALACLLLVKFLPRRRKQFLVLVLTALVATAAIWLYLKWPRGWWYRATNTDFVENLLADLTFARGPLAPNHWLTRGLLASARRDLSTTTYSLALIWSNGLVVYLAAAWCARRWYRRAYDELAGSALFQRRRRLYWLDHLLSGTLRFLDPQTRLLVVKDFRTFRRDPAQWAQILIFALLVVLLFTNMHRFYQSDLGKLYQNAVSIIYLTATSLLLCAYTGRFVFPMLSLEGKKFWILGLLPMQRERLIWGKFAFAATGGLLISEFLILFGDWMLNMPVHILLVHGSAMTWIVLGLSGLSVGLGACMPNFGETDPSKIAVGFGGTMNLVACLIFLVVEILLSVLPWHLQLAYAETFASWNLLVLASTAVGIVLAGAAVIIPLRLGCRALRKVEF